MNYNQLIKNWHNKAARKDYFSKFVFEYLAFIAYIKTQLFNDVESDRNAIQKLKQDQRIKNDYLRKIKIFRTRNKKKLGEINLGL